MKNQKMNTNIYKMKERTLHKKLCTVLSLVRRTCLILKEKQNVSYMHIKNLENNKIQREERKVWLKKEREIHYVIKNKESRSE